MAVELRPSKESKKAAAKGFKPTAPEGLAIGDLAIVSVIVVPAAGGPFNITTPAGWTRVPNSQQEIKEGTITYTTAVYYRVLTEATLPEFKLESGEATIDCIAMAAKVGTFKGSEPINVNSAAWKAAAGTTTGAIASVTTTVAGCLGIAIAQGKGETSGPAGWTSQGELTNNNAWSKTITGAEAIGELTYKKSATKEMAAIVLAITPPTSLTREATDTLGLAEGVTRTVTTARSAADELSASDQAARTLGMTHNVEDELGLSDSGFGHVGKSVFPTDTLGLSDSAHGTLSLVRAVPDKLTLSDIAKRTESLSRLVTDGLSFTETVTSETRSSFIPAPPTFAILTGAITTVTLTGAKTSSTPTGAATKATITDASTTAVLHGG